MSPERRDTRKKWESYLCRRNGTYDFRCIRYAIVAQHLVKLGLKDDDLLVDVGAGRCEFDHFLRTELKWRGRYVPVDGSLDGTDLEHWTPHIEADFFVAIELLEHLLNPFRLIKELEQTAKKGVVITTPNSAVVDTLAIDHTHRTPLFKHDFPGWRTQITSLGWSQHDSVVAAYAKG
jgi:hypothetical protein